MLEYFETKIDVHDPKDKFYIAGFNAAAYDAAFLKELFRRCESRQFRNYFQIQVIDLASIAAFVLMDERDSLPDFSLATVASHFGIETQMSGGHDCMATAELSRKLYNALKSKLR